MRNRLFVFWWTFLGLILISFQLKIVDTQLSQMYDYSALCVQSAMELNEQAGQGKAKAQVSVKTITESMDWSSKMEQTLPTIQGKVTEISLIILGFLFVFVLSQFWEVKRNFFMKTNGEEQLLMTSKNVWLTFGDMQIILAFLLLGFLSDMLFS